MTDPVYLMNELLLLELCPLLSTDFKNLLSHIPKHWQNLKATKFLNGSSPNGSANQRLRYFQIWKKRCLENKTKSIL